MSVKLLDQKSGDDQNQDESNFQEGGTILEHLFHADTEQMDNCNDPNDEKREKEW